MITLGILLTLLGGGISLIAGVVQGKERDDAVNAKIESTINERLGEIFDKD